MINDFGDNRLVANTVDGDADERPHPGRPDRSCRPGRSDRRGGRPGRRAKPPLKLLLATTRSRRTVKAGSPVVVRFAATAKASGTLTISRAGKTVKSLRFASRAGSNSVRWNGRAGKRARPPGAYRLVLKRDRHRRADGHDDDRPDGQAPLITACR